MREIGPRQAQQLFAAVAEELTELVVDLDPLLVRPIDRRADKRQFEVPAESFVRHSLIRDVLERTELRDDLAVFAEHRFADIVDETDLAVRPDDSVLDIDGCYLFR